MTGNNPWSVHGSIDGDDTVTGGEIFHGSCQRGWICQQSVSTRVGHLLGHPRKNYNFLPCCPIQVDAEKIFRFFLDPIVSERGDAPVVWKDGMRNPRDIMRSA